MSVEEKKFHRLAHISYIPMQRYWYEMENMQDIEDYIEGHFTAGKQQTKDAICKEVRTMLDGASTPDPHHRDFTLDFIIIARDYGKYGNQTFEVELTNYKPYGC